MFCTECGNQINDNAAVCPSCGVPVAGRQFAANGQAQIPNHMVGAILVTLFCCLIGGIVAIVYASQVNTKIALGDYDGAWDASKKANGWITVSVALGLVAIVANVLLQIAVSSL